MKKYKIEYPMPQFGEDVYKIIEIPDKVVEEIISDINRQNSEIEDVVASIDCQYESFVNELCQILFEGEDTEIGRKITIDRIKTHACYNKWLEETIDAKR